MIAARGTWIYDDAVEMPVDIVGLPYDFWYEIGKADEQLQAGEEPTPLNSDGVLYYVRFRHAGQSLDRTWVDSSGFPSLPDAMAHADARVASPIIWE